MPKSAGPQVLLGCTGSLLSSEVDRALHDAPSVQQLFDGDELTPDEMALTKHETAQFSVHVVGLVADPRDQTLYVADPNAGLVPGGSMEFVAVPLRERERDATTCVAQYDIDTERQGGGGGGAASADGRKRKRAA